MHRPGSAGSRHKINLVNDPAATIHQRNLHRFVERNLNTIDLYSHELLKVRSESKPALNVLRALLAVSCRQFHNRVRRRSTRCLIRVAARVNHPRAVRSSTAAVLELKTQNTLSNASITRNQAGGYRVRLSENYPVNHIIPVRSL